MQVIQCFLLSYIKYGDSDAILNCFTAESGYQSFFAKGLYTARNKKKPYLFPLNLLQLSVPKKIAENQISRISKVESSGRDTYNFQNISTTSILFFTADFLHQVLREEGRNDQLYGELLCLREELLKDNLDAYLGFLIKFLSWSGVAPLEGNQRFLNPESGVFETQISHVSFNENMSQLWLKFLLAEDIYRVKLNRKDRTAFLDSLMLYCQFHITNFRIPNSLAVVRELFD